MKEKNLTRGMSFRKMRERAGMTQMEVSMHLGIQSCNICDWEMGRVLPRAAKLPEIARLYGCTIDELLGYQPPGDRPNEAAS